MGRHCGPWWQYDLREYRFRRNWHSSALRNSSPREKLAQWAWERSNSRLGAVSEHGRRCWLQFADENLWILQLWRSLRGVPLLSSVQEYLGALHHFRVPASQISSNLLQILQYGRHQGPLERLYRSHAALSLVQLNADAVLRRLWLKKWECSLRISHSKGVKKGRKWMKFRQIFNLNNALLKPFLDLLGDLRIGFDEDANLGFELNERNPFHDFFSLNIHISCHCIFRDKRGNLS